MRKRMKKWFIVAVKVSISVFLITVLIANINWGEVWYYFLMTDIWFVGLSIVFYVIGLMISACKWQRMAQYLSFDHKTAFYLHTYVFGTFLNNFFPSFLGGDAYRIIALGKDERRIKDASTTIVVDRLSGLYATMILAVIWGMLNIDRIMHNGLTSWLLMGVVVCTICGGVVLVVPITRNVIAQKFFPKIIVTYVRDVSRFRDGAISRVVLVYAVIFTIVGVACSNYMLFLAMGVEISIKDFMSVIFLASIVSAIPVTIGNIGTKEWAYVLLFGIFGVSGSAAIAIVILSRALQMGVSVVAIPGYLVKRKNANVV